MFSEDPILLPEIVDQIVLVTVHPASEREDEELQRRRHSLRLLGRLDQHRPSLGRFFAPYAIERVGATLCYLPPYSPDLNPIELCFAKLKALVRAARCRSNETLWLFLGACLPHFSPEECRNYFRHCGYPGTTRS